MALDELVNTNILALGLIERALHDQSGWLFVCGDEVSDVEIVFTDEALTMSAVFEHAAHDESIISIFHHEQLVWSRPVDHSGGAFTVEWTWHVENYSVTAS